MSIPLSMQMAITPKSSNLDIVVQEPEDKRMTGSPKLGVENELIALFCFKKLLPHLPRPPDISTSGKSILVVKWCPWKLIKHMLRKRTPCINAATTLLLSRHFRDSDPNRVNHAPKPKFKRVLLLMQLVIKGAKHHVHQSGFPLLSRQGTNYAFDTGSEAGNKIL